MRNTRLSSILPACIAGLALSLAGSAHGQSNVPATASAAQSHFSGVERVVAFADVHGA